MVYLPAVFGGLLTDVYEGFLKRVGGGILEDSVRRDGALVCGASEPPMSWDSYGPAGVSASGFGELRRSRLFHGGFSLAVFPLVFDEVVAGAEGFYPCIRCGRPSEGAST